MSEPALNANRGPSTRKRVLLIGNPNAGKTTLFNLLTGARAKVGNYPGVTVERRIGPARFARPAGSLDIEIVDLPGAYSLTASSPEEQVAIDALLASDGERADAAIVMVDATALERGLYLAVQVIETGARVVVVFNMMDEARAAGTRIDASVISERLGAPVVSMVASRGEGRAALGDALAGVLGAEQNPKGRPLAPTVPAELEAEVAEIEAALDDVVPQAPRAGRRARAVWALLSLGDDELERVPDSLRAAAQRARARADACGIDLDLEVIAARYALIDEIVAAAVTRDGPPKRPRSERIDAVLTHRVWGTLVFLVVMAVVFESLFSWAEPAVSFIETLVARLQGALIEAMPAGALRDLLVQGVVAGVGNVLVFVPQIALLFVFIGLLEDSGYLARVAFVLDRLMGRVGLHGKAFVPMLSGYACAIPAVMATRTIESRRDRLLTMLVVPLASCSARLPVFVLLIATVFPGEERVLGVFSEGAVALFVLYALSAVGAIGAAAALRRTVLRGPRPTMVLELPPYRRPVVRNLATSVWSKVRSFLVDAGSVILALTIVLWALLNFPKDAASEARFAAARSEAEAAAESAEARERAFAEIESRRAGEELRNSIAGRAGRAIEPAIEPLGFDWRVGVGLLGAFAAREVFVSTMGIVFDVGSDGDDTKPLREALRSAKKRDGSPLMTRLTGASLMVFFVFACQCMSTIAVVRRESGSWKWPLFMFAYMTCLAYFASLLVYQVGRALGWGA